MNEVRPTAPCGRGTAIIGLGSPHGDDQVGWVAVDLLWSRLPADVPAFKASGEVEILELFDGFDRVIIIDAAAPAGQPGTVRSFVWPEGDLQQTGATTTHGVGLADVLRLAELLKRLPREVVFETVEAKQTAPGSPLSEAVERGAMRVVESVLGRLGQPPAPLVTAGAMLNDDARES
jgi:hydrogenase maturation protease